MRGLNHILRVRISVFSCEVLKQLFFPAREMTIRKLHLWLDGEHLPVANGPLLEIEGARHVGLGRVDFLMEGDRDRSHLPRIISQAGNAAAGSFEMLEIKEIEKLEQLHLPALACMSYEIVNRLD